MSTIAETAPVSKLALLLGRVLNVVIALCLRSGGPLAIEMLLVFYLGLMVLGWARLRDWARRVLIPCRFRFILPTTHAYGANYV